jgi:hypothetical protein
MYSLVTFYMDFNYANLGRAMAQAVSHWLPTVAARVQTRV